jgi:flavodoxin
MRSLVVYESWFGNTKHIAERIALALQEQGEVQLLTVDDAVPALEDFDLLVVGAPTHVHGLSGKRSREAALDQGAHGEVGIGVRGFIAELPNGARGPRAAAFDTRAHKSVLLVGSAARGIARRLREHGYRLAVQPESFFIEGTPGPLEEGEPKRAEEWAKTLANEVMAPTA